MKVVAILLLTLGLALAVEVPVSVVEGVVPVVPVVPVPLAVPVSGKKTNKHIDKSSSGLDEHRLYMYLCFVKKKRC